MCSVNRSLRETGYVTAKSGRVIPRYEVGVRGEVLYGGGTRSLGSADRPIRFPSGRFGTKRGQIRFVGAQNGNGGQLKSTSAARDWRMIHAACNGRRKTIYLGLSVAAFLMAPDPITMTEYFPPLMPHRP